MKRIYIAGAITNPDTWEQEKNIRRAEEIGLRVAKLGASPFIPHSMTRYIGGAIKGNFWLEADLAFLAVCDAIVLIEPGWIHSKGVKIEKTFAADHNIPIFVWDISCADHDIFTRWLIKADKDSKLLAFETLNHEEEEEDTLLLEYPGQWIRRTT